jgi:glycosyltransferase involved in cell wall biosynthesis
MSDRRLGTRSILARHRPVRVFSEARLHRAADGTVYAIDPSSGAAAWDVFVERLGAVELAARVGPADAAAGVPLGRIEVRPLPFYSGPRQLVRRLPSVMAAVVAATAGASICLFRLPGTAGLLGGAWCRLRGRRYVVEVIGDPASVLRSGVLGAAGRHFAPAAAGLMRWVVAGAAAGRYVTESTLQRLYPLAPGALEHHYSNVRLAEEDFTAGPRPRRPVRRLLAVGTHDQLYKGHDDLIRAVALLAARGIHVDLGLVGDGRHNALLRDLARTTGVADQVTFHGRVTNRTELRRLLDEADLFCMPSRTEGMPRALIEAMARGLPAMGTDVGGIRELLDRPFCVPPSDPTAVAALIADFVTGTVDSGDASRTVWECAQRFGPRQQAERTQRWLDDVEALARASS